MRITVMGTGGVGGYFGARLADGGCDVSFVARGDHLSALAEKGLRVESNLGNLHLRNVHVSDDPVVLGPADLILICVKLWDTESAARAIAPIVGPNTAVISLQNGVQKDQVIRRTIGDSAVLGGVCYISSKILSPGVISQSGLVPRLTFGEYDGSVSARAKTVLDACRRSAIEAEISSDIHRATWEKFVFLVGVSSVTTTMRSSIGPIRENKKTRAFLLDVMREVVAVGRAHGIQLAEDFAENRLAFCDSLPSEMTSSMKNDFEAGKRLEVDWLSGSVTELGKALGVPTPLNRAVTDILALHADPKQRVASKEAWP